MKNLKIVVLVIGLICSYFSYACIIGGEKDCNKTGCKKGAVKRCLADGTNGGKAHYSKCVCK